MGRLPLCRFCGEQDGKPHCGYYDEALRRDEDIRCYPGGWDCYEAPGNGCVFEGQWMTVQEYRDWVTVQHFVRLPEFLAIPDAVPASLPADAFMPCATCRFPIRHYPGQQTILCPQCGAVYEKSSD